MKTSPFVPLAGMRVSTSFRPGTLDVPWYNSSNLSVTSCRVGPEPPFDSRIRLSVNFCRNTVTKHNKTGRYSQRNLTAVSSATPNRCCGYLRAAVSTPLLDEQRDRKKKHTPLGRGLFLTASVSSQCGVPRLVQWPLTLFLVKCPLNTLHQDGFSRSAHYSHNCEHS